MNKLWVAKNPNKVFLYPTLLCNLKCQMCYSGGHSNKAISALEDLTLEEYKNLIDELYSLGIRTYDISGGEPFLRKDIVDICKHIKMHPESIVYLVSNGTMIHKKFDIVKECLNYVDYLKISIDSPYSNIHNRIRGSENAFELTQMGIDTLQKCGFNNIGINFVVMDQNVKDVPPMLDYALQKNLKGITLLRFMDVSPRNKLIDANLKVKHLCDMLYSVYEWIEKNTSRSQQQFEITLVLPGYSLFEINRIHKKEKYNGNISLHIEYDPIRGCPAFGDSIVITNSGMVTGCTAMVSLQELYIGDIKSQTLKEVYEGLSTMQKLFREREKILKDKEPCASCTDWTACRGGCPAAAFRYHNSMMHIDPTCYKMDSTKTSL